MFVTLPKVFNSFNGGWIVGILFFLLVLFAALTSSISLMETVVSFFQDKLNMKRIPACILVFVICLVLGIPSSLGNGIWADIKVIGMDFLTFFDFISNSVLMPIVALFTCLFIGFVVKPKAIIEEVESSEKFKEKGMFTVIIKYVSPICILLILGFSVLEAFGLLKV